MLPLYYFFSILDKSLGFMPLILMIEVFLLNFVESGAIISFETILVASIDSIVPVFWSYFFFFFLLSLTRALV